MVKKGKKEKAIEDKWVKKSQKREAEKGKKGRVKKKVNAKEVKEKKIEKIKEEKKGKVEDLKGKPEKEKEVKKEKRIEKIKFYIKKEGKEGKEKKKKPKFIRQDFHKNKRLKLKWRRPRGKDSKLRKEKRGKGKTPKIGYKNPKEIRGLINGYKPIRIENPKELSKINPKTEAIIISKNVGRKKRNEIIREANKLKITILNPRKGEI